jgi:DNA-binding NarL/FixJ family response regulator
LTTTAKSKRARYLPAFVEILVAANAIDEARTAAGELDEVARELGGSILSAIAAHARGAVLVAEGDHRDAIEPLTHAFSVWNKAGAPYLAARIRVLLGRAFLALGDADGASLERDAARKVFEALGASCDLAALDPANDTETRSGHGLSPRELEVLRLLARGKTNKAIAKELFVSERTIDRHVSNIFTKLDVSTRAAATAFAYENLLL